jgi:hypothetical protein
MAMPTPSWPGPPGCFLHRASAPSAQAFPRWTLTSSHSLLRPRRYSANDAASLSCSGREADISLPIFPHLGHPLRSPLRRALPPPLPSTTASPRRASWPENRRCVERLLEPLSSERSPEAAGHFFTIRRRERHLMVGLLRPFSDPAVASPSSA